MPKAKYAEIYKDLKRKIETGEYEFQELLPSENTMVQEYDCSRNTIRRAIGDLVADGYVQTMQGKGVRIIFQPVLQTSFTIGSIETFTESAKRNNQKAKTKVIHFAELVVDKRIAAKTGFNIGDEIYYLQRLHYLDGKALILNHNYFLKSVAKDLTIEIAEKSIYDYLENTLGVSIVTSKRIMKNIWILETITVWLLSPLILTIVMALCLNIPSHAIALITLASRIMQQDDQFSRKNMKQKNILFTDMDGTILFSDNGKTYFKESDLDAIKEFQQRGNLIVINSGRALPWIVAPLEGYLLSGMYLQTDCLNQMHSEKRLDGFPM